MDKLPSKNAEKLLIRIAHADAGKIPLSCLDSDDLEHLRILQDHGLVTACDAYSPENPPDSSVYIIGPLFRSVTLSSMGKDYISDLADEKSESRKKLLRDIFMLILGALVTLVLEFAINQLTGAADAVNSVLVTENSPANSAAFPCNDAALDL